MMMLTFFVGGLIGALIMAIIMVADDIGNTLKEDLKKKKYMTKHSYYILNEENIPVPTENALTWSKWCGGKDRDVKREWVGQNMVFTQFTGLNHRIIGEGEPLVFETDVWGVNDERFNVRRCSTWEEASKQHDEVVNELKQQMKEEIK